MKVISHSALGVAALYAGVAQAHPANESAGSFLAQFHAHPPGIGLLAIAALIVIGTALLGTQSINSRTARDKR